ncbi:MAG: VOC family protein [Pseudomonadota bacterium]
MNENPVRWFEIYVQDMARARCFYETVFATSLQQLNAPAGELEMWAFPMAMDSGGCAGSLVKMEGFPSGGNSTLVYFGCEDCAVEAARVAGAGGKLFREKMSIGEHGFIALAIDTDGNMLGMHSMK